MTRWKDGAELWGARWRTDLQQGSLRIRHLLLGRGVFAEVVEWVHLAWIGMCLTF